MKVIVTGCAGYIGSVLTAELLNKGEQVIGVDNLFYGNHQGLAPNLGHPGFRFIQADAANPSDWYTRDADVIFPLAALVGASICDALIDTAEQTNVKAIRRLMNLVDKDQTVIFPNTNSGYGQTDGVSEVTEQDPLNPVSVYGKTKCEAEKIILEHPRSIVLRLATVFGVSPRMRFDLMVNDFCHKLHESARGTGDEKFSIYEPHFMRNFVHVRDVVRAFLHFMDLSRQISTDVPSTGVFNCGHPGANSSKQELAERICRRLGREPEELLVTGDGKDPDQRNYQVSNAKILRSGFCFDFSLDYGIREVLQYCRLTNSGQRKGMRNFRD